MKITTQVIRKWNKIISAIDTIHNSDSVGCIIFCLTMITIGMMIVVLEFSFLRRFNESNIVSRMEAEGIQVFQSTGGTCYWNSSIAFVVFGLLLTLLGVLILCRAKLAKVLGVVCISVAIYALPWSEKDMNWMIAAHVTASIGFIYAIQCTDFFKYGFESESK